MAETPMLPSDRQLVGAADAGHDAAWGELRARHQPVIERVARRRPRAERREMLRRLEMLREVLALDPPPDEGEPAIRAFRPRALAAVTGGGLEPDPGPSRSDASHGPPDAAADDRLLGEAFARLPEPWQAVLWHCHVEGLPLAEVAPLVGRSAVDVTELLSTAERGLTDAFFLEYVGAGPLDPETRRVIALLPAHLRGSLSPAERRLVDDHLGSDDAGPADGAAERAVEHDGQFAPPRFRPHRPSDSRRLVDLVSTLETSLPPAIAPPITGLDVEEYRWCVGTGRKPTRRSGTPTDPPDRRRRAAMIVAAVAIVAVLVGSIWLLRRQADDTPAAPADPSPSIDPPSPSTGGEPAPTTPRTTVDPTTTAPSTTALDLRPSPSGPANTIELMVDAGPRAVGVAPVPTDVDAEVSTPAPVFAGGTGTLDVVVTNRSDRDVTAALEFVVPRGVRFEALVDGAAQCVDPADDSPFCDVTVAASAASTFTLRFALDSSVTGRLVVEGDRLTEPFETQIVAVPDLLHDSVGRGDIAMIGNTVMECDPLAAADAGISCQAVHAGDGDVVNRWDVPLRFLGDGFGLTNSSSATLDLPEDARVVAAHVHWSGDLDERGVTVTGDGHRAVTFGLPNGDVVDLVADALTLGDVDATQYLGTTDVTSLVASAGPGEYLVGNITTVETQGSYGAWSLTVVFDHDDGPRRHRVVTRPFDWIAPEPLFEFDTELPVPVDGPGPAALDVLAFEGERGFVPEVLEVDGVQIDGDNPFDSTIEGPRSPAFDNSLGIDIDTYALDIDSPTGLLPVRATSDKDGIRIAVLGLSVDLAS